MKLRWAPVLAVVLVLLPPVIAGAEQGTTAAPAYIETVRTFLTGWGHESWDEIRAVSGDAISLTLGDKVFSVSPAERKSDVMIVFPFRGLSTVRTGDEVKGVTVQELGLRVGDKEVRGPATVTLKEENGQYRVVSISVEADTHALGDSTPAASVR